MSNLDKVKDWFANNRLLVGITIIYTLTLSVSNFSDAVKKIKGLFAVPSKDTIRVELTKDKIDEDVVTINDTLVIKGKVDLFDLIKNLSPDSTEEDDNSGESSIAWSTESNNPHINWISDGFDKPDTNELYPVTTRTGYCVLANKGIALCNTLEKKLRPCVWAIKYEGAMYGVRVVNIYPLEADEGSKGGVIDDDLFKGRNAVMSVVKAIEPKDETGEYSTTYKIKIPGKREIRIEETVSCGSHYCSIDIELWP